MLYNGSQHKIVCLVELLGHARTADADDNTRVFEYQSFLTKTRGDPRAAYHAHGSQTVANHSFAKFFMSVVSTGRAKFYSLISTNNLCYILNFWKVPQHVLSKFLDFQKHNKVALEKALKTSTFLQNYADSPFWDHVSSDMLRWKGERIFWKEMPYLENQPSWEIIKLIAILIESFWSRPYDFKPKNCMIAKIVKSYLILE